MSQQATDAGHWALLQRAMDAMEREAELLEALQAVYSRVPNAMAQDLGWVEAIIGKTKEAVAGGVA